MNYLNLSEPKLNKLIRERGKEKVIDFSWLLEQIMTNPPLLSIAKSKGLGTGEKEYTPSVKCPM
jgi:hypothetical protein